MTNPPSFSLRLFLPVLLLAIIASPGCGGGPVTPAPGNSGGPVAGESTQVTVLLSSAANDKLASLHLDLSSITLTGQSGNTVTLLQKPKNIELIHLNGTVEPLLTATVPQDVYTSAAAAFSSAYFNYVFLTSNVNNVVPAGGPGTAKVNLAAPIPVSGTAMVLSLTMPVSQSANYSGEPMQNDTIAPVFNLAPLTLATPPTNAENGLLQNINGSIAGVNTAAGSFTLVTPEGNTLTLQSGPSTAYSGITGIAQLAAGQFVNLDAALHLDNSLLATRIEVPDTAASDFAVGPVLQIVPSSSSLIMDLVQAQGPDQNFNRAAGDVLWFSYPAATFRISSQYRAPQNFPAMTFTAATMSPGQNVFVSLPAFSNLSPPPALATVTLLPQTINGLIQSCSGTAPETCSVVLAGYDPISIFAGTSSVEVVITPSTQMLGGTSFTVGATKRFHGFLFSNNGALVMVCDQVSRGVAM
ncbi:MAG: DUF5666 domain-containing protein [Chlamydiota bacterium]